VLGSAWLGDVLALPSSCCQAHCKLCECCYGAWWGDRDPFGEDVFCFQSCLLSSVCVWFVGRDQGVDARNGVQSFHLRVSSFAFMSAWLRRSLACGVQACGAWHVVSSVLLGSWTVVYLTLSPGTVCAACEGSQLYSIGFCVLTQGIPVGVRQSRGAVCITSLQLCFGFSLQHTMCCAACYVSNQNQAAAALLFAMSADGVCFIACMLPPVVLCATRLACVFYLARASWLACRMHFPCAMHACMQRPGCMYVVCLGLQLDQVHWFCTP
jgi:hypothetical protein